MLGEELQAGGPRPMSSWSAVSGGQGMGMGVENNGELSARIVGDARTSNERHTMKGFAPATSARALLASRQGPVDGTAPASGLGDTNADHATSPRPQPGWKRALTMVTGVMPEMSVWAQERHVVLDFILSAVPRSLGQVVFLNNPVTGLIVLAALLVDNWLQGVMGLFGVVCTCLWAHALGLDDQAIRDGIHGYNGALVGLGMTVFSAGFWEGDATAVSFFVAMMVLLCMVCTVSTAALGGFLVSTSKSPPFTLPFNLTLAMFLHIAALFPASHFGTTLAGPASFGHANAGSTFTLVAAESIDWAEMAAAVPRGVGQIYFMGSWEGGVILIMGCLFCSRITTAMLVLGSVLGICVGLFVGAPLEQVYAGLWGYNPALGMAAIGGVFVLADRAGVVMAVLCAVTCALFHGVIAASMGRAGLPAMTLPFCVGTILFMWLQDGQNRATFVPLDTITTAEDARGRQDLKMQEQMRMMLRSRPLTQESAFGVTAWNGNVTPGEHTPIMPIHITSNNGGERVKAKEGHMSPPIITISTPTKANNNHNNNNQDNNNQEHTSMDVQSMEGSDSDLDAEAVA